MILKDCELATIARIKITPKEDLGIFTILLIITRSIGSMIKTKWRLWTVAGNATLADKYQLNDVVLPFQRSGKICVGEILVGLLNPKYRRTTEHLIVNHNRWVATSIGSKSTGYSWVSGKQHAGNSIRLLEGSKTSRADGEMTLQSRRE
jgi:hypothetical protein